MITLGGAKAWKVYRFRDLGVAFHWINDEPHLCLFPLTVSLARPVPYCLPLSSLHQITIEGDKVDGGHVIEMGMRAAHVMGRSDDRNFARNCADAILNYAGELLRMPPTPDWLLAEEAKKARSGVGDVIQIKMDGETIHEQEL